MRHKLHTVIKGSVTFDVDVLAAAVRVGYSKQFISVATVISCPVYLQFYAKISRTITVENWLRFVPIIMNTTIFINFVVVAFRAVVIAVEMISVSLM